MLWGESSEKRTLWPGGDLYSKESGTGWVIFDLPETGDASDAALIWPGGEWRPSDQLQNRLATSSSTMSVEEWHVPETAPLDSTVAFELTVRNGGDEAGRFVAGINAKGWYPFRPLVRLSREIPAGETVSWEIQGENIELKDDEMSESVGNGTPDIEYELLWPNGNTRKSVRIVEGESAGQSLVIESRTPVGGTMVNMGVEGVAKNASSQPLADCIIDVTGDVGDQSFSAQVMRGRLAPDEVWDWDVSFDEEADASRDDTVENISIETKATYAE